MSAATENPGDERPLSRRLRHRRRDLLWRLRLRWGRGYGKRAAQVRPDPACPELAIGAVAMGDKYADWCLSMIASLRGRGEYSGPVYVITDLPDLFEALDNVVIVAVPPTQHRLIAKSCKQVLMEYVEEPVYLYLDSDLVITSSIHAWYRRMKPELERAPVLCYSDVKPCPGAFHGGVVLVNRENGMPIIRRWYGMVRTGRWGSDQACLYAVAGDDGPAHLPQEGFMFLRHMVDNDQQVACIVHITNGIIREYARPELEHYMANQLGVTRMPSSFD